MSISVWVVTYTDFENRPLADVYTTAQLAKVAMKRTLADSFARCADKAAADRMVAELHAEVDDHPDAVSGTFEGLGCVLSLDLVEADIEWPDKENDDAEDEAA